MNKNVLNTYEQIQNTVEMLSRQGIIRYTMPCDVTLDSQTGMARVSWKNHIGGRNVSSKAFNNINQYIAILSSRAYLGIMIDYSIIRVAFVFKNEKLVAQNLLWWPCPVRIDEEMEQEFGLLESVKLILMESDTAQYINMRTPVRIDFDSSNDTTEHPRAHVHMQHYNCRINCREPICFNRFMRFILETHYPDLSVSFKDWNYLDYQYPNKHSNIVYRNVSKLTLKSI